MKSYFQFLAHQLKGWPQQNYYLFFFSLGCQVMTLVNSPSLGCPLLHLSVPRLVYCVFYPSMRQNQSTVF